MYVNRTGSAVAMLCGRAGGTSDSQAEKCNKSIKKWKKGNVLNLGHVLHAWSGDNDIV